jgi:hypothetical protein
LPRSSSHNGPTNPRNKPKLKATRKHNSRSKGLRQSALPGRTVRGDQADDPRGAGGRSARSRRTVQKSNPNLQYAPSVNRTVRELTADCPLLTDSPTNKIQPKPTGQTDRNETTLELTKNTTNTRSAGSSRTVRDPLAFLHATYTFSEQKWPFFCQ